MMRTKDFELTIPTNISFTLYRYDYMDSIIISRVLKECKNIPTGRKGLYKISVDGFKGAIKSSKRLTKELEKLRAMVRPAHLERINTLFFLWIIIEALPNLKWLTFKISDDKSYTRIMEVQDREILTFHYTIEEGVVKLSDLLSREQMDELNKEIISLGLMENKYFDRSGYFWMRASQFFDLIASLEKRGVSVMTEVLGSIDPKIDDDDPALLIVTDYTNY